MSHSLLSQIETHVVKFFNQHPKPDLLYHNLTHTQEVVQATEQMAKHYKLDETDFLAVMAAAWFHDSGHLTGPPEDHEERSADLAAAYLKKEKQESPFIKTVKHCIRATKMPQSPKNLLEQIICDADLFHLGGDDYKNKQKLLRKEQEKLTGTDISGSEWRQENIALLETHRYFTDYAQALLGQSQAENLRRQKEKQAEKGEESQPELVAEPVPAGQPAPVGQPITLETPPVDDKKKIKKARPIRVSKPCFEPPRQITFG
jgi:predicted metal-dependent HD superfamily phosphohydrolase